MQLITFPTLRALSKSLSTRTSVQAPWRFWNDIAAVPVGNVGWYRCRAWFSVERGSGGMEWEQSLLKPEREVPNNNNTHQWWWWRFGFCFSSVTTIFFHPIKQSVFSASVSTGSPHAGFGKDLILCCFCCWWSYIVPCIIPCRLDVALFFKMF